MNWFYADDSGQKGPHTEFDFTNLARNGTIKPTTLVWHEGLPDWQPLTQVRPDLAADSRAPSISGVAVPEQHKDLIVQQMREGVVPGLVAHTNPYGLVYAGFWIRFAAKMIDGILLTVVNVVLIAIVVLIAVGGLSGFNAEKFQRMDTDPAFQMTIILGQLIVVAITYTVSVLYNAIMVWKWDGTVGKLAVGIRVVREDGSRLTLGRAIGRGFADLINQVVCILLYIMAAFDDERRALHDHICSTRVVVK